jgi:hypothetical protein
VIEAFQLGVDKFPGWFYSFMLDSHQSECEFIHVRYKYGENAIIEACVIYNLYGSMTAYPGDMIIKEMIGGLISIYSCKKYIFDATYELVEN